MQTVVDALDMEMPSCVLCARLMEPNTPERWANEPDNHPGAWWNRMDYYCPHCHTFQNAGDVNRYVQPSGKTLATGRRSITIIVQKHNTFNQDGISKESATSQPMSD